MAVDANEVSPTTETDQWVERFTLSQRIQHFIMLTTMMVLLLTGIILLFHEAWWAAGLVRLEGGMAARGLVHRTAAVVLMFLCCWHAYQVVFTRWGHEEFMRLKPTLQDLKDFLQMMRFNLGTAPEPPHFDKYSYAEKVQYAGVVVGSLIMIGTGLLLWFENISMAALPKWVIDVTTVVHGYNGVLAFIVLLLWHLYNVHLNPRVFPMNKVWLTGTMSLQELREQHYREYLKIKGQPQATR